jgi:PAS domain S-box-containing protein
MKKNPKLAQSSGLRKQAEDALQGKTEELQELSIKDAGSLIHELQVHQIELEMQNEELRRVQKELEESRDRYSDLYDFAPVGYFSFDKNGLIIEVNLTGATKLGVERNSLIKKPFSLYISPDSKNVFYLHLRQVFMTGFRQTCELKLVDKKGIQLDVQLESISVKEGNSGHCRTAMSDITDHKRTDNRLRENEERLRLITDAITEAFWIAEVGIGKILYISPAYEKIWGRSQQSLYENPRSFIEAIHPDDVAQVLTDLELEKTGQPFGHEYRIRRPDGTLRFIWDRGFPIHEPTGEVLRYVGIAQDITERKNTELEFKTMFQTSLDGFWIIDMDGRFLDVNDAYCHMTGYSPAELMKMRITDVEAGEKPEETSEHLRHVLNVGADRFETRHICKDDRIVDLEVSVNYIEVRGGRFFVSLRDITDRKKAEELRLENERLISVNKTRSEFLMIMSHELRTPLTSVIGYSIILQEKKHGELNEEQRFFVDTIIKSSKHLLDLINNFLELAKIEAGKLEMVFEEVYVPDVINEIFEIIRENAIGHNIILKKEFYQEMLSIQADRRSLRQILFNLLSNAIKFSKKEGGTITISTKRENDMVRISVEDTGIGIKEEDLPRLFQKFEQLDSGISRKYEGTGLGLAITKQLVEMHGGKIWVESKYGQGSNFIVLLPIEGKK